ncbi:hypothetical protein VP1G_01156 [Cytospora mali]|uniref:Acyltransferase 3 domain-containing protein n=1 Tax=Cytospora mali TaxID=578113 RepID=A0A194UQA5_CYTMA|nr:hypothetical protein VP1G_01156 [Valsa mali var. pyri (nom. inval.)]
MSANFWGGSAPQRGEQLLPQSQKDLGVEDDAHDHRGAGGGNGGRPTDPGRERDKIRCLDGLRGIACFLVFNYHFLWPWTPLIMLGYGARVPNSPEPFTEWASLPIICLLHRGRPMVAIFFAISGYVLCRHMLRLMHQRRLDDVYKRLASAVFRRVFRLYIPPTISMFIVALLAQMGAFKSEDAVYKGPDSAWINGTVTKGFFSNGTCSSSNGTVAVMGNDGIADALGLQTPLYLNSSIHWNDTLCLNSTSKLYGAAAIYTVLDKPKPKPKPRKNLNGTVGFNETTDHKTDTLHGLYTYLGYHADGSRYELPQYNASDLGLNATNTTRNFTWVQLGGMWEEHPHIHPNIFKALANFTVVYTEWANPFNFGHYHPRYDPHTYTIPMELRGSMVLYTFLLGTAALKARWRLGVAAGLSLYALTLGRWDMGTFLGGMVLSEIDVLRSSDPTEVAPEDRVLLLKLGGVGIKGHHVLSNLSARRARMLRWGVIFLALWLLSYPDAGAEYTPGFRMLAWLAPRWYLPISKWMYYQSIGALLLIPCVMRSPTLRNLLEGSVAQYLGKVSFSFYLIHGPVLHSLGFWIMPHLFEQFGRPVGYVMGWFMLLSVTLWLVSWWHRKVDTWSVTVGRRVERALVHP